MARETSAPVGTPPRLRRRHTALRASLLAQIGTRKGLGSDKVDLSSQARRVSSAAKSKASVAGVAKEKEQERGNREKRNCANDADNEVPNVAVTAASNANANGNDSSQLSNSSVIRYEDDPCATPPYKLLAVENHNLARRVDSLEIENAALHNTRLMERERLTEINAALADKIGDYRQEAAFWEQQAGGWKSQALDRDGEVQRLRMKLQELVGEDERID